MLKRYNIRQLPEAGRLQTIAECIAEDYFDVIFEGMAGHERSLQKLIGPSEIGEECQRALVHKLMQDPEPPDPQDGWKPAVGTALHAQMEVWFGKLRADDAIVEQRVAVGMIGPDIIRGSTDLFYKAGIVGDHKFVGTTRLKEYARKGPGKKYRTQAHLYGRGWHLAGHPVTLVMIFFVPRDGKLSDSYVWWEPFDEQVAIDALANANRLYAACQAFGKEAVLAQLPLCQDHDEGDPGYNKDAPWCAWCRPARNAESVAQANQNAFSFK